MGYSVKLQKDADTLCLFPRLYRKYFNIHPICKCPPANTGGSGSGGGGGSQGLDDIIFVRPDLKVRQTLLILS